MSRLTEKQSAGYDLVEMKGEWCDNYCAKQSKATCRDCAIWKAIQKLAHYEDLEEQGGFVEVTRCKDCRWKHYTEGGNLWCDILDAIFDENYFCSFGETEEGQSWRK